MKYQYMYYNNKKHSHRYCCKCYLITASMLVGVTKILHKLQTILSLNIDLLYIVQKTYLFFNYFFYY